MLCLSRKVGERILIGGETFVEIIEIKHDKVKLGVTAPKGVSIFRTEILDETTELAAGKGAGSQGMTPAQEAPSRAHGGRSGS